MRKDLLNMQKALKQIKNPNFEEYKAEASTTGVNIKPNLNISDAPKPKANIKGRTFEFDTMKKDLMKGLGMLFGYPDKQLPS
tara:strand:- start:108 stop:353 length:246 start_codon:yes stop_codon:yes gene_type:complete